MHHVFFACLAVCSIILLLGTGCAAPAPLRVMSFNIRYGDAPDGVDSWLNRRELLFTTIEKFSPDLLGTQEVLAYQSDELRARLRGYGFAGGGRDDGKRKGEFSAVYFRADRFAEIDRGNFWLSETPEVPGKKGWDATFPRIVSWVKLRDRKFPDRPALLFLNTHLDNDGVIARRESARLIVSSIDQISEHGKLPVVLAGDFNTHEDDPAIITIEAAALTDSYREIHPQRTTEEASFHAFKGEKHGSRIDFIFHSQQLRATAAEIDYTSRDGHFPSDHFPVTAILDWK